MDDTTDAGSRGEASSSSADGALVEYMNESIVVGQIPEEIFIMIFCKLPLRTLFQMQIICTSWQSTILRDAYFHNLWEQNNLQKWLVMELYDETGGSSNGLIFYDVNKRLRYKNLFNKKWTGNDSQWFLRAGDGGLLIYSCKKNGTLQAVNPLTMQSHYLEDARLTRKRKLSYYMKKYHDDVAVQLNFDPKDKSYQVTVIIGNLNILRSKKFIILIYKSVEKIWDIRNATIKERMSGVSLFPSIFM